MSIIGKPFLSEHMTVLMGDCLVKVAVNRDAAAPHFGFAIK